MKAFEVQKIKGAIKDLLKKNKIGYEEVAAKLECSIPTVKRILGPEELTLSRLLEICELLDISLGDLQTLIGEDQKSEEKLTPAQEAFLAKNSSHFAYLMKLFDSKSPKQIAEQFGLNARSTEKYLIALEKHDLIKVSGGGKVRPAFKRFPRLGQGVLAKAYFKSFIQKGADLFIRFIHESFAFSQEEREKHPGHYSLHGLKISRATFREWQAEREKALGELSRRSAYEEKTRPESELMTVVLVDGYALVDNDYRGLSLLDSVFGKIENL